MTPYLQARLQLAIQIARDAGEHALGHFRSDELSVERKDDGSPVTVADRGAERLMRRAIEQAFPEDGIHGEEDGHATGKSDFHWILDPIDGTRSFTRGVPLWGVLVAVEYEGEAAIGVINMPAAREIVWAGPGVATQWSWDGKPARSAHVSSRPIASGFISMGSPRYLKHKTSLAALDGILELADSTRGWADCYQHLLVATGRIEAAVDPGTAVWDNAALKPVVEGAGGRFTSISGKSTIRGDGALSSNGLGHEELVRLLATR